MKTVMIDVPSGWKYGFPKPIPNDVLDVKKWIIEQGYPKKLMNELGEDFWYRFWQTDTNETKKTKRST